MLVGMLGLGVLGMDAALKLKGLGFRVAGWSATQKSVVGIDCYCGGEGLRRLLSRTDILVALLPLTNQTRGLLNASLFAQSKRGGRLGGPVLVNAGRGGLQVEADILAALDSGILKGASLDVFEREPLPVELGALAPDRISCRVCPSLSRCSAIETQSWPTRRSRVVTSAIQSGSAGSIMSARSGASANAPVSMWQIWMMAEADHASGEQTFRCRMRPWRPAWVAAAWESVCTQQTGLPLCLQRVGRSVTEVVAIGAALDPPVAVERDNVAASMRRDSLPIDPQAVGVVKVHGASPTAQGREGSGRGPPARRTSSPDSRDPRGAARSQEAHAPEDPVNSAQSFSPPRRGRRQSPGSARQSRSGCANAGGSRRASSSLRG